MLIDWFTVGAQALNFTVLVWLLKRFLYQPVLDAIAAREALIARQIADAAAAKHAAQTQLQALDQQRQAFDAQRAGLLDQATSDAQAERTRLMAAARQAVDAWRTQRQDVLRSEATLWQQSLTEGVRREVFEITRRVLADLATAGLEERLVEVFVQRLADLDAQARTRLSAALTAPGAQVLVQSAFALPNPGRSAIQATLKACAGADVPITYATCPEQLCGITLTCAGEKLSWSVDQYLGALEHSVGDLLLADSAAVDRPAAGSTAVASA